MAATQKRVLLGGMVCLMAVAVPAWAGPQRDSKVKGKGSGNIRVDDADARAVQDLGQLDIEGRVKKPSVYYMLARSEVKYSGIEFKQNFTDRIVKGAMRRPF
jgi:hypothetical protein